MHRFSFSVVYCCIKFLLVGIHIITIIYKNIYLKWSWKLHLNQRIYIYFYGLESKCSPQKPCLSKQYIKVFWLLGHCGHVLIHCWCILWENFGIKPVCFLSLLLEWQKINSSLPHNCPENVLPQHTPRLTEPSNP